MDDHERLPVALSQRLGPDYGDMLSQWWEIRNRVDSSLYIPTDLASRATIALSDATVFLAVYRGELQNRGVSL